MTDRSDRSEPQPGSLDLALPRPPTPTVSVRVMAAACLTILVSGWLAVQPGSAAAQEALARWMNQPPPPLSGVLAVLNPLLRPLPLLAIALAVLSWILLLARGRVRREAARALVVSVLVSELLAQALKLLAAQPRPTAVLPGLDDHGYPGDPLGSAFPSAHAAVSVAVLVALWPWTTRGPRVAGTVLVVLIALHRMYIGAHWPLDIVGGAAVGLLAAALSWLVAARWPYTTPQRSARVADREK